MNNVRWEAKPFLIFFISIIAVLFVFACTTEKLSLSVNLKKEYNEMNVKGVEVQSKLKQTKEKLQTQYTVKKECSDQVDTLYFDLFEGMDALFATWNEMMDKKHDKLIELEELSNKNFSIWLAVIAAICTVLPVVLALHQNNTFDKQFREYEAQMDEEKEKNISKINDIKNSVEKREQEIDKLSDRLLLTTLLDICSRNLIVINNLSELEVRENVFITCTAEIKKGLEIVLKNIEQSNERLKRLASKLDDDEKVIIINSYLCMMCIFREMLYRYESEFTGENLMRLQQNRYLVSLLIQRLVGKEGENSEDLNVFANEILGHVSAIKNIFDKEINKLIPQA